MGSTGTLPGLCWQAMPVAGYLFKDRRDHTTERLPMHVVVHTTDCMPGTLQEPNDGSRMAPNRQTQNEPDITTRHEAFTPEEFATHSATMSHAS